MNEITDARLAAIEARWFKAAEAVVRLADERATHDTVDIICSNADVPVLVREVRLLREENERLRAEAGKLEREREAYQRGEQDSRGNPMPCLHLDEADAVLAALREAYQRGEQDSRGNPTPCLHPDSIEERQNATDAAQEGGAK